MLAATRPEALNARKRGECALLALGLGMRCAQHGCPSDHVITLVLRRTAPSAPEEEWKRVPGLHGMFPVHV